MAYCLRSFVQTIDQILHPHQHHKKWILDHEKMPQIQSIFETATFLRDFLDKSSPLIQERITNLEDEIMAAAEKAENSLELYITNQILMNPENQSFTIFPPDLSDVMQVFEIAKQKVLKIMDVSQPLGKILSLSPSVSSKKRNINSKEMVVGVTEDLMKLKNRLTLRAGKLDIIPIVGMGGTGKTTLARIIYDELSSSNSLFDRCAWVTFSQSHDTQLILQTLLACVTGKSLSEMPKQDTRDMIVTLYKTLFSRRYLIVLDDIWSCKAWDDVKSAFPQDDQGSRIILTTRENIVADYVNSNSHQMRLIDMDSSWELLRNKVFGKESCPSELEEIGKRIAINCGGLPLALQVIGGLLSQSQISKDFWEHVAYNVSSYIAKEDDQFSGIFSWSFAHLPHYLKPCFLYMGAFPEDHEIEASKVIRMWVTDGFLYPIQGKSPEEAAEIHLNALVERNLIFVRERKCTGKVRSYGIHDLLRDLCLKKAHDKKFVYFKDSKANVPEDTFSLRRVHVYSSDSDTEHFLSLKLKSVARSFHFSGSQSRKIMSCLCYESSLLRVLDVFNLNVLGRFMLPEEILQLVNLRYLAIFTYVPNSISLLRNLQILIVYKIESVALLLVDMPQLRQLSFNQLKIESYDEGSFSTVHENLQRLSNIPIVPLTQLLGKLPNLKKLGIAGERLRAIRDVVDLNCFHKLESLTFSSRSSDYNLLSKVILPDSIKKLTLWGWYVDQAILDAIGMLPNLQILKLVYCNFVNSTWEPCEGGFCELKYLSIERCFRLENWIADETHFPVLEHLILHKVDDLIEIPNDIGRIDTLEIIEMKDCLISAHDSVVRTVEEQHQFGNTLLQLRLGKPLNR